MTAAPATAHDPDPSAPSINGQTTLRSGFQPDPFSIQVRAGGVNDARSLGSDCRGFVANQPDYKVSYQPGTGSLPLIFHVQSSSDTMLAINGPDGTWYCDDDSADGNNPAIRFLHPQAGRYDVFVGTYASGVNAPARLRVSELNSTVVSARDIGGQSSERPDPSAASYNGQTALSAGFSPDPRVVNVQAGGTINARVIGQQCTGFVGQRPDYKVEYRSGGGSTASGKVGGGQLPLMFGVRAGADTMLAINGPDGRWYCDDDSGGDNNPLVTFSSPQSGRYDIFVGTYASGATVQAQLTISERAGGK